MPARKILTTTVLLGSASLAQPARADDVKSMPDTACITTNGGNVIQDAVYFCPIARDTFGTMFVRASFNVFWQNESATCFTETRTASGSLIQRSPGQFTSGTGVKELSLGPIPSDGSTSSFATMRCSVPQGVDFTGYRWDDTAF